MCLFCNEASRLISGAFHMYQPLIQRLCCVRFAMPQRVMKCYVCFPMLLMRQLWTQRCCCLRFPAPQQRDVQHTGQAVCPCGSNSAQPPAGALTKTMSAKRKELKYNFRISASIHYGRHKQLGQTLPLLNCT